MSNAAKLAQSADFSRRMHGALARRGVYVIGTQGLPGTGDLPMANMETGYVIDDNGTCRVVRFADVLAIAERPLSIGFVTAPRPGASY